MYFNTVTVGKVDEKFTKSKKMYNKYLKLKTFITDEALGSSKKALRKI